MSTSQGCPASKPQLDMTPITPLTAHPKNFYITNSLHCSSATTGVADDVELLGEAVLQYRSRSTTSLEKQCSQWRY